VNVEGALPSPLLRLVDAKLGYGEGPVLSGVNLSVAPGDFLAIVGPNGAGKTTLLRALLGVLPRVDGERIVNARLGYAPQRSTLDSIFPFVAREVVAMGLMGEPSLSEPLRRERVGKALAACGLTTLAETPVRDMSGGQKQRVVVARALVSEPDVLVLDEPTNDLDLSGEHEVMELVARLQRGGCAVVMVTHMIHLAATYAERIAFISDRSVTSGDADDMLRPERLRELFGVDVVVGEVSGRRVIAPALESSS
jgi:ABC-type Mn2+/Zn2+ transport system ATPase subunit